MANNQKNNKKNDTAVNAVEVVDSVEISDSDDDAIVVDVVEVKKTIPQYSDDFFAKEKPVKKLEGRTWKKTPTVFQMEATECGAACLGMIMRYYGSYVPLEKLRIDCGVSRDGSSATNIIKAASKYGLDTEYKALRLSDLVLTKQPCIIHWNFNHFVVFEGIKHNYAYINDPGEGRRRITLKELDESFTGYAISFKPNDKFIKEKETKSVLYFAFSRLRRDKHALFALILFGVLITLVGMLSASFTKFFIDQYFGATTQTGFPIFLCYMGIVLLFQFFFIVSRGFIVNRLQAKLSLVSGYSLVAHMLKLPINFYEQRYAGDLSQRITNNDQANVFLSGRLTGAFLDIFSALLFIVVMLAYSVPLTIISVLGGALSLLISKLLTKKVNDLTIKYTQDSGKLSGVLFSGIEISQTLKASGVESKYASKIMGHYSKVSQNEQKIGFIHEMLSTIPRYITQIVSIIIIVVGAYFVINSNMTTGTLVAFCSFLTLFMTPLINLFTLFKQIQELKASIMRVEDIESQKIDKRFTNKKDIILSKDKLSGRIEINDLSFAYSKYGKPFIQDFNLSIEPGEVVALVGPTGCGKTTIAKLICGLVQPWSGEILYDGVSMSQIDSDVYSVSVGYISQDISIFEGSIKDNLTMWNDFVMDKDIIQATKDACIHETITKLPRDYSFVLKEDAVNLSGGQKQRLEIARALVSRPSILIMDEATSALDAIVEQRIMQNLKKRGCTCIIVAHRLSTIRDADKIMCIDEGKVVDVGTHEELINKDGLYKKLIADN